jgi:hypothetical protein
MRHNALKSIVFVTALVTFTGLAQAADQTVKANVTLNGFNNSNIVVGFKSTDAFDGVHTCKPGSGSSCTAQNGYGSPPKNIGNFLCIPNSMTYQISSSCQSLLSQGTSQDCHSNSESNYCAVAVSNSSQVSPSCNWRTNNNTNTVNWNWTLTYQGGVVTVDCSNSNYQGTEQ